MLSSAQIPYGATLYFNDGDMVNAGDMICEWDPFNNQIIIEEEGTLVYDNVEEGVTMRVDHDAMSGMKDRVIIESKDKQKAPAILIFAPGVEPVRTAKGDWEAGHDPIRT